MSRKDMASPDYDQAVSSRSRRGDRAQPDLPQDGIVRIFRGKGGRGGKTMTVVRGLPPRQLDAVAKDLRRFCGAGGSAKEGAVEIQGDHREKVAARLSEQGYTVKLAGG
jgi:translation initiation factor 1